MSAIVPEVAWALDCALGEGPIWLPDSRTLSFVDIKRGRVHHFDPATQQGLTAETGGAPSFIVPTSDGTLLVGSRNAIHRLGKDALDDLVTSIPEPVHNRTNDATVDNRGRLWFGTMDDEERAVTGAIWCLADGVLHRAGPRAVITNGPASNAKGDMLYHVDTGARTIYRSPLGDLPILGDSEVFIQLGEHEGYPDGIVVDSEECLWVGLWDGWGVRRYAPDGSLLLHVPFPCARVTKIAFGGDDLRTVYATTARIGLDDDELARQPLAGSLFSFRAPAPGFSCPGINVPG